MAQSRTILNAHDMTVVTNPPLHPVKAPIPDNVQFTPVRHQEDLGCPVIVEAMSRLQ